LTVDVAGSDKGVPVKVSKVLRGRAEKSRNQTGIETGKAFGLENLLDCICGGEVYVGIGSVASGFGPDLHAGFDTIVI
jgi:hypothetical protein